MYNYSNYPYSPPPMPPLPPVRPRRHGYGAWFVAVLIVTAIVTAALNGSFSFGNNDTIPIQSGEADNMGFQLAPTDPLYDRQYALEHLNATQAWETTAGKSDLIVAVIDTGVDPTHPDLVGKLVKGKNFVTGTSDTTDTVGHGTFVASLIAANVNDGGISGIAPNVKIMPLKVLQRGDDGSSTRIAQAIRYAADNGAKVINMSLGSPTQSRSMLSAIQYALSKNVVIVAAAGNEGNKQNIPNYPAAYTGVISVGATGTTDRIATFSNHDKYVTVSAPGVNVLGARSATNTICRPYTSTSYCTSSGTSFAAPYVAGVAALVLSANPDLTPTQVTKVLTSTAHDLGTPGRDDYYGYGLVDAGKAVLAAKAA